jgi:predicted signal transduction protein with EAL and GGDEF domain
MVSRVSVSVRSRLHLTRLLTWGVIVLAAATVVWALPSVIRFLPDAPDAFWAMAVGALVVDVPLSGLFSREDPRVRSTLSICFTFAIFVLWGLGPGVLVQAVAGAVSAAGQRYTPVAGAYLVSRLVLATAVAELVVGIGDPRPVTRLGTGLNGGDLLSFFGLAAVWFAISYGLLAVARSTVRALTVRQTLSELRVDMVISATAVLVVAPLLTTIRGWWTLLVAIPLILYNQLAREQARREQRLGREPESGLLNRQGLNAGLQAITATDLVAPQGPRPFGIVLVNFESVLDINRALGRELYEKVVGVASRRLIDAYGPDRAARLSGEGIVILMPDLTEPDAVAATEAAVSLLDPLVEVDDIPFALDPAGGVALSPMHGRDLGTLLMKAELAAAEARRTGQRAVLYVRKAAESAERRIMLLRELHSLLRDPARHHELTVLYQPQVHIDTGQLAAVEALLRWTHPEWGPIPTDELIGAVEPSEIMHMLTRHVLTTVAEQMRHWNAHNEPLRVSVNVSVQDLHEHDFVAELGELVRAYDLPPRQLVVEITERMLISDMDRVRQVARELGEHGVGLSLDDFGTGYASLQQLRQLPLQEVKVDRSYINNMVDNPADRAIVTSVYQLTRALGVDVVAEGVEDERTAKALATLGGTIGQGWYFGKPMAAEDLRRWRLADSRRRNGRAGA